MREKILLDENWLFHCGEIEVKPLTVKGPTYMESKTERKKIGPACYYYNDAPDDAKQDVEYKSERWSLVHLPHDYIIGQTPVESENNTLGYFKYENAWYRKHFKLDEQDKNRRITLLFEGIAVNATIYLNGCLLKHNFCGYTSFEVDITDYVVFDKENILAVHVTVDNHEGWWYEGAGIYRHVWMVKTDLVAVDLWGVYVAPKKIEDGKWCINFETTVINETDEDVKANTESYIKDKNGNIIATAFGEVIVPLRDKATAKYSVILENPVLWDLENPYMYNVETVIETNENIRDSYTTRFGCRTFELDPDKGLFLNGKHVKIKGVCGHQDFGLTGKAVPDNIHRYKMEMIKQMGANGYRTSHYPQTEAIMDALDELGFIVMAEARWFESTTEGKEQLEMLMKRDRNRPSVLFWSLGNEEPYFVTDQGRRINKSLAAFAKKLDNTRVITCAVSHTPDVATIYNDLDVIGINYNIHLYDSIHEKYPNKPIVASECCATGTTRGWYLDNSAARAYINTYDKDTDFMFTSREKLWKFVMEREWVLGAYQWIAFEHRGETVWPRLCSQSGAIDLFLQKKDAFYQNKSHWSDEPMVHILPHWNWENRMGEDIPVWTYTNCGEAELFVNGESYGRKEIEKHGHGEWMVKYAPGKLTVVGYNGGAKVTEETVETTGKPVKLMLRIDNTPPKANGQDIALITCYCVDEKGRFVPDATPFIKFDTNSIGKIVGTGSDVSDHNPVTCPDRKMRAGFIGVAVQVGKTPGILRVYAECENLTGASIAIDIGQ